MIKTLSECMEYLNKRVVNNQNIEEVSYFNSILYYLQISNNKEPLNQAEIDALLEDYQDSKKDIIDFKTKIDNLFYEKYGYKKSDKIVDDIEDYDYIVSAEEKERLLRNIQSDDNIT